MKINILKNNLGKLLFSIPLAFLVVCQCVGEPDIFKNPILSGFHPDPSITLVGDTYYLTNSTFEWYPALPIHKSKDLVNWELIGHGINSAENITFQNGLRDSLGIFAPTIRYHQGTFYIITTCVGCGGNFYITANDPAGPWSAPIWVKGAVGIDPSLYWEDGKAYYIGAGLLKNSDAKNTKRNYPWPGKNGIWMQEIDLETGSLLGSVKQLTFGHASNAHWAEGPHLYKIDNEYLLLIGEGGTNEFHAVTVFNSKSIWGPYVPNQVNPVLTHRHLGDNYPITQVGHADLVQTQKGDWWSVMLGKRPVDGVTLLSRETFLAKVEMTKTTSGVTPVFNPGIGLVQLEQARPNLPWTPVKKNANRDNFSQKDISLEWNSLRSPTSRWYSLENEKLLLNIRPEKIEDLADPSFLGKRMKHQQFVASTHLNLNSDKRNEKAGLVLYRRSTNNYQLMKGMNDIVLIKTNKLGEKGELTAIEVARMPYSEENVVLQVNVKDNLAQFSFGPSATQLKSIGERQALSILSDEVTQRFNGVYVGVYATSDGQESNNKAIFDWFEYTH